MKPTPTAIVMATRNKGKIAEIERMLDTPGLEALSLDQAGYHGPMPEENADTFSGNAELKADFVARATGLAALADDSGLCVDALDGAPGVRSARFAGLRADDAANNQKLLDELGDLPDDKRTAHFFCAACLARPDGEKIHAEGRCDGVILRERRGEGGFGYDPLFYYPPLKKTFAEIAPEEKNEISHRARAMASLREKVWGDR